jgi:peptidoglycan/LPS O-acetylase OafA/YrhL
MQLQYRKEIDGLRAIAVIPVIFFHGGVFGFDGGYVGVDIFFVISGFLITSIILNEKSTNTFSLINFYERRARRILPALSVVLLFTTIAAFLFLPADLLADYSRSLASVSTFSSNIFFYLTSGYFSIASDHKPLLHTWSLAIEEQYYVFFPLLLMSFWFLGKRHLGVLIALCSFASLLFSEYLALRGKIDFNFYLIFSRAWELGFGSLLAFVNVQNIVIKRRDRELLSCLGILLISYAILFFDRQTPFPGFYALIPVSGVCIIIAFANQTTYIGKILASKYLVSMGLISYSLYLWHQPLFAFLRLKTIGEPALIMYLLAIALTFILASISYKFVEQPFRNKALYSRKAIFQLSAFSTIFFLVIGLSGHAVKGFANSLKFSPYTKTLVHSPKRKECHTRGTDYLRPDKACQYFGSNVSWAVLGDSHTVEPAFALANILKEQDVGLIHLSFSGCPPAILFDVPRPGCSKWTNEALSYLEDLESIDHVLIGYRYSMFLQGNEAKSILGGVLNASGEQTFDYYGNPVPEESKERYWQSFYQIISRLIESGKTVYVLYPIPELPAHISKVVSPFSIFNKQPMLDLSKSIHAESYFHKNSFILDKLDSLQYSDNLHAVKPFDLLCDSKFCPAVNGENALYYDSNHLSVFGAKQLISRSGIINIPSKG